MEEIQKSMQESAQLYIGYNLVYFEQDNLSLGVYFDMSSPKTKVIDSRVIAITVYSKDEKKSSDFEFLGLNNYGVSCQHLYLDETENVNITPEFLNIAMSEDGMDTPLIDITVY